jgi:methionine-rich copper-binding protein CopC
MRTVVCLRSRRFSSVVVAVVLLAASSVAAPAQPLVLWSDPATDGFLVDMPVRVTIGFSQPVAPGTKIAVTDADGNDVTDGATRRMGEQATVPLIPLVTGLYTVRWTAVATEDSSEASGRFEFFHLHLH